MHSSYGPNFNGEAPTRLFLNDGDGFFTEFNPSGLEGLECLFIRAPRILRCGSRVEVLATREGDPVLVRSESITGACFHPELQAGHPVTAEFVASVRGERQALHR